MQFFVTDALFRSCSPYSGYLRAERLRGSRSQLRIVRIKNFKFFYIAQSGCGALPTAFPVATDRAPQLGAAVEERGPIHPRHQYATRDVLD